jgi:AAA domain/AAA domain, putative AbiEii toxin, Type IV TA system
MRGEVTVRLLRASISGFRRFANATVNLDGPLIAIVGPNEAGKTSVLDALGVVEDGEEIQHSDRTRGVGNLEPGDVVVELRYVLEQEDIDALLMTDGDEPRWFVIRKRANGIVEREIEPDISRPLELRKTYQRALARSLRNPRLKRTLSARFEQPEDETAADVELRSLITRGAKLLETDTESIRKPVIDYMKHVQACLLDLSKRGDVKGQRDLERLLAKGARAIDAETEPPPREPIIALLERRRPKLRPFADGHRRLDYEYSVSDLGSPTPALENLLLMAGVTPVEIREVMAQETHHERAGLQARANRNLEDRFGKVWDQGGAAVFPQIHLDAEVLRIHVPSRDTMSPIKERSDGLRTFVSLVAFTDRYAQDAAPILLIDEAERHLHYDAQADLIRVFEEQTVATQIVFTTHSAGCLPSDLGVGVRAVQPVPIDEALDSARSTISSEFWADRAGFTPLLFAMGASALAFAPSRIAVLTEGRSDPILLPTLLRSATGKTSLGFQVAPGIANISRTSVRDLDLEAPRVAYLLDGDQGGKENAKKLIAGGVPKDDIVHLPGGRVLEDFVHPDVYLESVNEELRRSHGASVKLSLRLPAKNRPHAIEAACTASAVDPPSKVRVAYRILERRGSGSVEDSRRADDLRKVYEKLAEILKL